MPKLLSVPTQGASPSELKLSNSHTMIAVQNITNKVSKIRDKLEKIVETVKDVDQQSELDTKEKVILLTIQDDVVQSFADLRDLTNKLFKICTPSKLETDRMSQGSRLGEVLDGSEEEDEDVSAQIQVVGTGQNVDVQLKRLEDRFGMTPKLQKKLRQDRDGMKKRFLKLQKQLDESKVKAKGVTEEQEELFKRTSAVNKKPLYECTVSMTAKVPKETNRGKLTEDKFRCLPCGKCCQKVDSDKLICTCDKEEKRVQNKKKTKK